MRFTANRIIQGRNLLPEDLKFLRSSNSVPSGLWAYLYLIQTAKGYLSEKNVTLPP